MGFNADWLHSTLDGMVPRPFGSSEYSTETCSPICWVKYSWLRFCECEVRSTKEFLGLLRLAEGDAN